jgi:hypothetical protein
MFTIADGAVELEGRFLYWSSDTGEPKTMPMSRQSFAVKTRALTGTTSDFGSLARYQWNVAPSIGPVIRTLLTNTWLSVVRYVKFRTPSVISPQ